MQAKVQIMYACPDCQGDGGYIEWGDYPDPEALVRYEGCPTCRGKGLIQVWIELVDLYDLLIKAANTDPMAPDWQALSREQPVSQRQASCEDAGLW